MCPEVAQESFVAEVWSSSGCFPAADNELPIPNSAAMWFRDLDVRIVK